MFKCLKLLSFINFYLNDPFLRDVTEVSGCLMIRSEFSTVDCGGVGQVHQPEFFSPKNYKSSFV